MSILVTGGLGYIGSHTCVRLLEEGYDIVILDNLSNSSLDVKNKIFEITGKSVKVYVTDLLDNEKLEDVFKENNITDVIHFAGFKAVGESVEMPLKYYTNNITGTLNLLNAMRKFNVKNIVFSSSATVYGIPKSVPITEEFPLSTTNPYGTTKLMLENIIKDVCVADNEFKAVILRYFNPIGAHKSGLIGERPNGVPNNLLPYVCQTASGKRECLSVFGNDYPTQDGTGVRDYIHVMDLAEGHIKALEKLNKENTNNASNYYVYNLGTGNGYSVLEIISTFEKVNKVKVNYKISPRRPGDVAKCFADATKAKVELGWVAKFGLEDMLRDSWNFEVKNNEV